MTSEDIKHQLIIIVTSTIITINRNEMNPCKKHTKCLHLKMIHDSVLQQITVGIQKFASRLVSYIKKLADHREPTHSGQQAEQIKIKTKTVTHGFHFNFF